MKSKTKPRDADIRGEIAALRRAARAARKLARDTNTPFWVMKGGRVVNLNASRKAHGRDARAT
jgi:hypothetical protein